MAHVNDFYAYFYFDLTKRLMMSCCVERIDIFCQGRNFCIFLVSAMFCTAQAGPQVTSKLTWTEANTGRHSQGEGWKLSKFKLSFCL